MALQVFIWSSDPRHYTICISGRQIRHHTTCIFWSSDQRHYTTCISGRQIRDTTLHVSVVGRSETLHYMYLWWSDQRHYTTCISGRQIRDTTLHVSAVGRSETQHYMYLWWSDQRHYTACISGQMEDGRLGCPFGLCLCISGGQIRDTRLYVSLVVRSETLHCMYLWSDGGRQAWLSVWSYSK